MARRDSHDIKNEVVVSPAAVQFKHYSLDIDPFSIVYYFVDLYRNWKRGYVICPLDTALLNELKARLDPETREIVTSQIAEVNSAEPIHYGKKSETILHKCYPFVVVLRRRHQLNYKNEVVIMATATFKCNSKRYKVDYVCVRNKISMLEYNRSTKDICNKSEVEILDFDLEPSPIDDFGNAVPGPP